MKHLQQLLLSVFLWIALFNNAFAAPDNPVATFPLEQVSLPIRNLSGRIRQDRLFTGSTFMTGFNENDYTCKTINRPISVTMGFAP